MATRARPVASGAPVRPARLDGPTRIVLVAVIAMAAVYGVAIRPAALAHRDHKVFASALEHMRGGDGYYRAMHAGLLEHGITPDRTTAYRFPLQFVVLRWVPAGLLYPFFLAVVVVLTCYLLLRVTTTPAAVPVVAFYLLIASRVPGAGRTGENSWLLSELWTVPATAGALVLWQQGRDRAAAAVGAVGALVREITLLLLAGGALAAWRSRRRRWPWAAAAAAVVVAFAAHLHAARSWIEPHGNSAVLFGTGRFPATVLHMVGWGIPTTDLVGAVLWVLAAVRLHRTGGLHFLGPLLALPIAGVWVDRPYWGLTIIPFTVLFAIEQIAAWREALSRASRRARTAGAGSSPPPGTPTPAPGTPAAVAAPPSA